MTETPEDSAWIWNRPAQEPAGESEVTRSGGLGGRSPPEMDTIEMAPRQPDESAAATDCSGPAPRTGIAKRNA